MNSMQSLNEINTESVNLKCWFEIDALKFNLIVP